jgi:hypothetical protein
MLTVIKNTNYVNKQTYVERKSWGIDISSEKTFNEKTKEWETETKFTPAATDYFPNTNWKENNLSYMIPAGIIPNETKMLKINPLEVGDLAAKAADIIQESEIDEIIND